MTKALVFAASTRKDSLNRKLARAAADELSGRGLEVTLADLRDYPMPLYDGDLETGSGIPEAAREFRKLLDANEIFVIASPEYNGSFPALLKNVIDWTSRPSAAGDRPASAYRGKTAVILATSPGQGGGRRGLRHLRELLEMIGMRVVIEVPIARGGDAFDAEGHLARPEDIAAVAAIGEALASPKAA